MKVLLINGSPRLKGNTYTALEVISKELFLNGVDSEIITVGNIPVSGCIACKMCKDTHKCFQKGDIVNQIVEKIKESNGVIIGSPVYYASINGNLKSLLDRVFYCKDSFAGIPASSIAVARRAGTTDTLDVINKYFSISSMPIITSSYWNVAYGRNEREVLKDEEGIQTLKNLAKNMAYIVKCIDIAKKNGVELPKLESGNSTNFIK